MLDLLFIPLNALDHWLARGIPDLVRTCLWGGVSGIAAMALYYLSSNQQSIAALKREARGLRSRMIKEDLDHAEVMKLARSNLATSLRLLGRVLGPSLLASVPVLVMVIWLGIYQTYSLPGDGSGVDVRTLPPAGDLEFSPPDRFNGPRDALRLMAAPDSGPITIRHGADLVYRGDPAHPPVPVLYEKHWWNALIGNPAGYLAPDSGTREVRLGFPRKVLIAKGIPRWAAGWEAPFFVSLLVVALVLKFVFRVE